MDGKVDQVIPGGWYSGISAESVVQSTVGLDVIESSLSVWRKSPSSTCPATLFGFDDWSEAAALIHSEISVLQVVLDDGKVVEST